MNDNIQARKEAQRLTWLGHNWGNLASVIGLAVTVINAWQINALRQRYTLTVRVPQINQALQEHCAAINGYLANFEENRTQAQSELIRAVGTLKELQSKLPRNAVRTEIKAVRQQIATYGTGSETALRDVYDRLTVVTDAVGYRIEDAKWKN